MEKIFKKKGKREILSLESQAPLLGEKEVMDVDFVY